MNDLSFGPIYDTLKPEVLRNENKEMVWKEKDSAGEQSFVGYMQIFSDKTAIGLNNTTLVDFPMHVVLTNFKYLFQLWWSENGHTIVGYLPVKFTLGNEVSRFLSKEEKSTRYRFFGNREI